MVKKILLFGPPFSGHLNVLKGLVTRYRSEFDFHLVITGWTNVEPDLGNLNVKVTKLGRSELSETDPAIWTFPRVLELLGDCLDIVKREKPDLIIYDFFSPEGNLAGKLLNIPYWCSIPALVGPFVHKERLEEKLALPVNVQSTAALKEKYGLTVSPDELEMISDGLHLPGQVNLVWSYPALTPADFMTSRKQAPYKFVGHPSAAVRGTSGVPGEKPLVYFSFGTVVMDNLWNQLPEFRERLKEFVGALVKLWEHAEFDVLFVSRGKPLVEQYPPNWRVVDHADQLNALSQASVFVTHAGGNSFHEAVLKKVPMAAVPFFGDQPLVAGQIEKLGLGTNLVPDSEIDTKKSKEFLNSALAVRLDKTVRKLLEHPEEYQERFSRLPLKAEDPGELIRKAVH